ncbi:MAG: hypothetical protein F9K40_10465 [Kofleriaceae bacterium]|nr:MAG: hypothetical protein F9K40_10465 [Kofleriaceae bacterium]MBZ0234700.1 hypothetical protein [Kofleriaceae bacterium]
MTAIRIAAASVVASSVVALVACTELGDVERDECGNGVVEPASGEDCDGAEGCGEPGTEQACRILCSDTVACPGNAACGLDGVCHAPGGTFALATTVPWTTPHLLVADTSGDGYPELVGVGAQHVDVRLGARDLSLSALPVIPSPPLAGTPQVADLEGDGDADITLPVGLGVFSLSGSAATVLDPFFYNSFDAPADGRIVANAVEFANFISVPLIAAHDVASGMSILLFPGDDSTAVALFPTGRTVDELVGENLPVGTLVTGSLNVRAVALPFTTGRAIALYDVTLAASLTIAPRAAVMLPLATEVKNGAWFADFDGDGHQDLVVSVEAGGVEALAVAWGNGNGGVVDSAGAANQATVVWRADRDQDGQPGLDGALEPVMVAQVTDNLLVLGDENDADVIAAGGLYTTHCVFRNQCALHLLRASTRPWSGAIVSDLNKDGLPDVAAFADHQTGIDLLLNTTTTLLFNDAIVPTQNAVERLITGDFNGDAIEDLAYVDAILGVPFTDALSVAYGQYLGPPSTPVAMGTVGEMIAGGGLLANGFVGGFDYIDDIVLVTDRQVGGETRRGAAFLFGSTTRRMFAPLLADPLPLEDRAVSSSVVAEVFTIDGNGDPYADLVVLTETVYGPSAASGEETAGVTVPHARFFVGQSDGQVDEAGAIDLSIVASGVGGAHWIGADVIGSPIDEAVGLRGDGGLVIVRLDGGCTGPACITPVAPPEELADPTGFRAVDADDDGDLDLLAVMRNRGLSTARGSQLVVWWNDDGFSPTRIAQVSGDGAIVDAAFLDLTRDGVHELVVLEHGGAGDGLRYAQLTAGTYSALAPLAAVTDGVALQSADVNGDGLDDLVVVTGVERSAPRELSVYTQSETRIPAGAE